MHWSDGWRLSPESLVQELVEGLRGLGARGVKALEGIEEHVSFPLPKGLGGSSSQSG